jgi:hypothetical protein
VHPPHVRRRALELRAEGVPVTDICDELGLSRRTVGNWFHYELTGRWQEPDPASARCRRCAVPSGIPPDQSAYAYLLGSYLGDGHLVTSARVPVLRIYCTTTWPGIISECREAMVRVLAKSVHEVKRKGCVAVQSYSTHWPCYLPQHGPGKKHQRVIALAEWQQDIVDDHPGELLRGLFHSDGCRVTNRVTRAGRAYTYPRYMFANESGHIMELCRQSLDRLGIGWRMCRRNLLSVARRDAVAALDQHVGPKS